MCISSIHIKTVRCYQCIVDSCSFNYCKILKMCLIAVLWLSIYIILHVTVLNDTDLSQPHRRGIRRGLVPLYLTGSSSRRQLGPHTWSTDKEHTMWQLVLVVFQSTYYMGFVLTFEKLTTMENWPTQIKMISRIFFIPKTHLINIFYIINNPHISVNFFNWTKKRDFPRVHVK